MSDDTASEPVQFVPAVPDLIVDDTQLAVVSRQLSNDDGPIGFDTERASGFRYWQNAYLIQLKTAATGVQLIDPVNLSTHGLAELDQAIAGKQWILHAASQDLPSLRQAGLNPTRLFDTELAARLLGYDHVGLGPLIEQVLGVWLAKDHANSDWSVRPLPQSWLSYAAGDVEFLIELADRLQKQLDDQNKSQWAKEEFEHILTSPAPPPKVDPWRSTKDLHAVRTRRGLALVRQLWQAREDLAKDQDLSPHRIVNDRAITAVAAHIGDNGLGGAKATVARTSWAHHVPRQASQVFVDAVDAVAAMPEDELPVSRPPRREVPAPGLWPRKRPEAAERWDAARPAIKDLAEQLRLPVENLISPRPLRALLWSTSSADPAVIDQRLAELDVRPWQRELVVPVIAAAIVDLSD
ncbi:MAG: HRDC domain-containing protein [Propionibacteriaceae bacterium]|jgi:ribonuclease D|nr:HRDC domain-containing protein [Propionibacteriaceae bacterium]